MCIYKITKTIKKLLKRSSSNSEFLTFPTSSIVKVVTCLFNTSVIPAHCTGVNNIFLNKKYIFIVLMSN
jgi:hypothetical protein